MKARCRIFIAFENRTWLERVLILPSESFGVLRSPVVHRKATKGNPKKSSTVAAVHGIGRALSTSLLPIL